MDTGDLIEATRAHRVVEIMYRSRGAAGARVVHPHAVYRTAAGKLLVEGVQVSGETSSGSLPGWREFELMRVTDVRLLDATFSLDPAYNPGSPKYRHGLLAAA
jgi:predicted DNA-binding transcriptional regulator YafY